MSEFYDIYPKDRWKDPTYRLMDKFSLKGKKGFVTGGAGGIGRNIAAAWAEAGADVALVGKPGSQDRLEPLAREMEKRYGVKIVPLYCDVSDKAQTEKLEQDLVRELGTIDIAAINAGICLGGDDVDVPYKTWKKVIEVDLHGAYLTAQIAQHIMRRHHHGGSIVITSSKSAYHANFIGGGPAPSCAYGTAKAGVSQMARYLAAGLAPYGIRVNTISPGYIWSGIHEGVMDQKVHDMCLEVVPLKRFGTTEEVQGAAAFLASDASAYITGINLPIDGGYAIY